MIISCYKGDKFNNNGGLLQEWQVNDNKSNNNNKDKIYSILKR